MTAADGEPDFLVVASGIGQGRWVVHRPVDPYGGGLVHRLLVEVSDNGLAAAGSTTFEGRGQGTLLDFLLDLKSDWRGWPDIRSWTAMEGELTLEATHDGTGHISLAITLRRPERPYDRDAWSATIVLTLEAGEQLHHLTTKARNVLTDP